MTQNLLSVSKSRHSHVKTGPWCFFQTVPVPDSSFHWHWYLPITRSRPSSFPGLTTLKKHRFHHDRKYQSLKGAVGATLCHNEAEVKFPMEISPRFHPQNKQGKSDLVESSIGKYSSASFRQRVAPTAPFNTWDKQADLLQGNASMTSDSKWPGL